MPVEQLFNGDRRLFSVQDLVLVWILRCGSMILIHVAAVNCLLAYKIIRSGLLMLCRIPNQNIGLQ